MTLAAVHPLKTPEENLRTVDGHRSEAALRSGEKWPNPSATDLTAQDEPVSSEFNVLLDYLDTDGDGQVSALELANFVDCLLASQDSSRPGGSLVLEAVLHAAMRHSGCGPGVAGTGGGGAKPAASTAGSGIGTWERLSEVRGRGHRGDEAQHAAAAAASAEARALGAQCVLSMSAVRDCFAGLLQDAPLWTRLSGRYSVMTLMLFRQLLLYSGGSPERTFSMRTFARHFIAFNTLPLWLPFTKYWASTNGVLFSVYLHQRCKLAAQLGPFLATRLPAHATLLVLTVVQFVASYVPLMAYMAAHGLPNMLRSGTLVDFMQNNVAAKHMSFYGSILPYAVLQFLTSSGALKLSCRDFVSLKDQCKAVFQLGDANAEFEGYPGCGLGGVMDAIRGRVAFAVRSTGFARLNGRMPLLFGIGLELFRRLVRKFLVRNWVAEEPLARACVAFEVYALVYNIWFAYSESADCTAYVYGLKQICIVFKALLNKEEAASHGLIWLNNHSPRNLLLWAKLRRYYQCPNTLELRWIEMHLTVVILAAVAVTAVLLVSFVQGTLLLFTPENADLQLFVAWVIPAFVYLIVAVVLDVIMSASTGAQYQNDLQVLTSESVALAGRLNRALEPAGATERAGPAIDTSRSRDASGGGHAAATQQSARQPAVCGGADDGDDGTASSSGGGGSGGGHLYDQSATEHLLPYSPTGARPGGGGGMGSARESAAGAGKEAARGGGKGTLLAAGWGAGAGPGAGSHGRGRLGPAARAQLKECQEVITSLVSYIQFNPEHITLFGVPIDTHLRNTIFSLSVTLVGAALSAFLAIIVRRK